MGTRAEDDCRRSEHARLLRDPELRAALERSRARREAEQAAARRARLHSFGLAGGRR